MLTLLKQISFPIRLVVIIKACFLYTPDAADEDDSADARGCLTIKNKLIIQHTQHTPS
mgnify:CR=1 FL=1